MTGAPVGSSARARYRTWHTCPWPRYVAMVNMREFLGLREHPDSVKSEGRITVNFGRDLYASATRSTGPCIAPIAG